MKRFELARKLRYNKLNLLLLCNLIRWAHGNTGRIYYQHQQTPNQTDPINQLHRAHQTAIFRLRTHHAPLNAHLRSIKKEHPAKCVHCPDSDESVEHFLFLSQLYDNIRSRLLPAQPTIQDTTQLQRTATYNMSAMNRCYKTVRCDLILRVSILCIPLNRASWCYNRVVTLDSSSRPSWYKFFDQEQGWGEYQAKVLE